MHGPSLSVQLQKMEHLKSGGDPDEFGGFGELFCETLNAMGLDKDRQYVTSEVGNMKHVLYDSLTENIIHVWTLM